MAVWGYRFPVNSIFLIDSPESLNNTTAHANFPWRQKNNIAYVFVLSSHMLDPISEF